MGYTIKTNSGAYVATVRDRAEADRQLIRCDLRKPDDGPHYYEAEALNIAAIGGGARDTDCGSVFSDDDLRRILEWHEEVRSTCGISADDDNLRKRIVGALRSTECRSVPPGELGKAEELLRSLRARADDGALFSGSEAEDACAYVVSAVSEYFAAKAGTTDCGSVTGKGGE